MRYISSLRYFQRDIHRTNCGLNKPKKHGSQNECFFFPNGAPYIAYYDGQFESEISEGSLTFPFSL